MIKTNNINSINHILSQYNTAYVYGKGPTFKNNNDINTINSLHIAINDTIEKLNKCDMFVFNDIEVFNRIDIHKIIQCKLILLPMYPHLSRRFNPKCSYKLVIDKLNKFNYNGFIIIYNLKTNPNPDKNFITLNTAISTSNTAIHFICNYLSTIKNINTFGIGIIDKQYNHNDFKIKSNMNKNVIALIRNDITSICSKYPIKLSML